jgi:eukaryotic-like serine/threonine-protein kinase
MGLNPGQIVYNRYRIARLLDQGGMGAVYRAWDLTLNIPVALKEMLPDPNMPSQQLSELREQFRQEAQVLATLMHPNLPRVTDFFDWHGNNYLVMDFIEGESLASMISRYGSLPEQKVLNWAKELFSAIELCHQHNVLHRDIKPHNIIVRNDGRAVLVDFGLVKLWDPQQPQTQQIIRQMGTLEYAPLEQFGMQQKRHTDPRSDVYSLAATLYHALVGQKPPSALARLMEGQQIIPPQHTRPSVPPHVTQALMRALELDQEHRFQTMSAMKQAIFKSESNHRGVFQDSDGQQESSIGSPKFENKPQSPKGQWPIELSISLLMAASVALVQQMLMLQNLPIDFLVKLSLGSMFLGGIGWFIGDIIFQALTQPTTQNIPSADIHRPTQKLVMSTRKFFKSISTTEQIALMVLIVILAVVGAWTLGPKAFEVKWLWRYFPSYAMVGPLVYAAVGKQPGRAFVANVLVVLIGGLVLKKSVGIGAEPEIYLLGAVLGGVLMESIAWLAKKMFSE